MRYLVILFSLLFIFSCENEYAEIQPVPDFDATIAVTATIQSSTDAYPFTLIQGTFDEGDEAARSDTRFPPMVGFQRNNSSSLVSYLSIPGYRYGSFAAECLEIKPGPVEFETLVRADEQAVFVEFVGIGGSNEDCHYDSTAVYDFLQEGVYELGQEPGQVHLHFTQPMKPGLPGDEFFLGSSADNAGLEFEVTEVDYSTAPLLGISGVYFSFRVPLAKGFSGYAGEDYQLVNFEGRMFIPFNN